MRVPATPLTRPRWPSLLLLVSLALNLFFGGLLVGDWISGSRGPQRGAFGGFDRMIERLPPESRAQAAAVLAPHREEIRRQVEVVIGNRRAVAELFAADSFDPAAAQAALGELQQSSIVLMDRIGAATLELAEALPADARRRLIPDRSRRDR